MLGVGPVVAVSLFSGWLGVLLGILFIVALIAFLIGVCLLFAALVSFNNFYYEKRGGQIDGLAMIGELMPVKIVMGMCVSLYSLVFHWRDYRFGRKLVVVGILLLVFSSAIITIPEYYDVWIEEAPVVESAR